MSNPLRIAMLGVDNPHGAGWRDLLLNVPGRATLTTLVPGYGGNTTNLEERYADLPRHDSVEALIDAGGIDGAMVCLSNQEGVEAIEKLAAAGIPVLAEKPVVGSVTDGQRVLDAVTSAQIPFQTGYMWRYDDCTNRLRDMIADGRFGKLISIEMNFVTSDVRRRGASHYLFDPQISGGGFFNWLACHYLDLLLYVTGESVVGVTARADNFGVSDIEVEDGGVAIMDLQCGALATFVGGYWIPRWAGEANWTIRGSERWVRWDPGREDTGGALDIHGPQPQWYAMEDVYNSPVNDTSGYGGSLGVSLLNDWFDCIEGKVDACRNTAQSMFNTISLIETIYESSKQARRVDCQIG
ncbi:MAG: Gfo/Idh/MocA family oxidoreductase [Pirellulales bacterium]|nr:Gfo/Idh/MocA family oxidoreductase [Pirellulales bacterium]